MQNLNRYFLAILSCGLIIFSQSCKKDATPEEVIADNMATIRGVVYAADHSKTIPNAEVYTDVNGTHFSTKSLTDGSFALRVPAGSHTIHIRTGNGDIFHSEINLSVVAGQVLQLDEDETELLLEGNIAYIAGAWDYIENVITALGYPVTEITAADVADPTILANYAGIFVNCGAEELYSASDYANLAQYVTDGGSLYVSDFAVTYLIGNSGSSCPRPNGFVSDDVLCTDRVGTSTLAENATLSASDLQAFLGIDEMDIYYDLGGWEKVLSVDETFWEVLISHSTEGALLLRTNQFSNDDEGNQGNIYFTTFHNEAAGAISPEVNGVLEFVVLNL